MSTPTTHCGEPARIRLFRLLLILAMLGGLLSSLPLWLNARNFPRVPVCAWLPVPQGPWDWVLLLAWMTTLSLALWRYRAGVGCFLIGALYFYLGDQNRGQPWFYLYCLLLGLMLFPGPAAPAACRFVLSGVYFWAGLQKCGPQFQQLVVPYMLAPVSAHWPGLAPLAEAGLRATPAIELLLAGALWIPGLQRVSVLAIALMHGVILWLLGPWGHDYNFIVWPWNLAMAGSVALLFHQVRFKEELRSLRQSIGPGVATGLILALPALSYLGWWDSYFSFALYSGNTAKADMFVVPAVVERLPEPLRRFAHPLHESVVAANPGLRGLMVFDLQSWSQAEVKVPPIPEPRCFRTVARAIAVYAQQPAEVQLIIQPRRGEPVALDAEQLRQP